MKALLVALNASFVHTNLAVRLLQKTLSSPVDIEELTINESKGRIINSILGHNPSHIFWSVYIWNWEIIKEIGEDLRRMDLGIKQFVGGPEVSYLLEERLKENPWIEGIIAGEGEKTFPLLMDKLQRGENWKGLPSIAYRNGEEFVLPHRMEMTIGLDDLPTLDYKGERVDNRILYYEAMRGCPYKCAYCLSSLDQGVRYRSIEKVKEDLRLLFASGSRQIKFVDRSFSLDQERALDLIHFIKDKEPGHINVHFELNLENLDPQIIEALVSARPGLFQIEAGVQSTNPQVLKNIHRPENISAIEKNMAKLGNSPMHKHLDLIVGLPGEDMDSFLQGFDRVYNMSAHRIQIGFLKLLPGTLLRERAGQMGIAYEKKAPYTVLKTKDLQAKEILFLRYFEEIVETFYDEEAFKHIRTYIIEEKGHKPSWFLYRLAKYYKEREGDYSLKSQKGKYQLLYNFLTEAYPLDPLVYEYIKMDFYRQEDQFIERVLPVIDREMNKNALIEWLRQVNPEEYRDFGKDIHRVARMCRGIGFKELSFDRLYFYKDHKYVRHIDRSYKDE